MGTAIVAGYFTGPVSDVPKYMSAFDVLVHPTYREGFGMVLQEAAALKVPIITTDIIGPGEFIQRDQTGCWCRQKIQINSAMRCLSCWKILHSAIRWQKNAMNTQGKILNVK